MLPRPGPPLLLRVLGVRVSHWQRQGPSQHCAPRAVLSLLCPYSCRR